MSLIKAFPALVLGLTFGSPALALGPIPTVPSLWPAEDAFDSKPVSPMIATKDVISAPDLSALESTQR